MRIQFLFWGDSCSIMSLKRRSKENIDTLLKMATAMKIACCVSFCIFVVATTKTAIRFFEYFILLNRNKHAVTEMGSNQEKKS